MIKHLFLDLEDTIITPVVNGWGSCELCNVTQVKKVIADFKPDQVHIFSFAIHNMHERGLFITHNRKWLEETFNVQFSIIPTVDEDIIPACCSVLRLSASCVDFSDASAFWSKQESFRLFVRHWFRTTWKNHQEETEVLFLDDAVINEKFEFSDLHIKGQIVDVTKL